MKLKNILMTAAVALVTVASANAGTISYSNGDLLLGIRNGGTTDLVIDLGAYTSFDFTHSIASFANGSLKADLDANFSGWATSTSFKWAIVGVGAYDNTIYTTNASSTAFYQSFDQSVTAGAITNVGQYYGAGTNNTTNAAGVLQTKSASDSTWANNQPGGTIAYGLSFGQFDPSNEGTATTSLYLNVLTEGSENLGAVAAGQFSINTTTGNLTYTAVPEPSTYAMIGLGGLGMLGMFRRRAVKA